MSLQRPWQSEACHTMKLEASSNTNCHIPLVHRDVCLPNAAIQQQNRPGQACLERPHARQELFQGKPVSHEPNIGVMTEACSEALRMQVFWNKVAGFPVPAAQYKKRISALQSNCRARPMCILGLPVRRACCGNRRGCKPSSSPLWFESNVKASMPQEHSEKLSASFKACLLSNLVKADC